jgi:hypothetical protein
MPRWVDNCDKQLRRWLSLPLGLLTAQGWNRMIKNMGTADRLVRTVLALIVVALYFAGQISGPAAIILGIFAVIFLLTSSVGFCPLYIPLKLSTRRK